MNPTLLIILTTLLLIGHYRIQLLIYKKGSIKNDPRKEIKRLIINGSILIIFAIITWWYYVSPYGLIGTLIFIESAVSFSYANKLIKRNRMIKS